MWNSISQNDVSPYPKEVSSVFRHGARIVAPVGATCAVEVDGNALSVPWRLIGEPV